ncbi:MAG: antitoxin family protein [Planctomycetes bacterium]|nr:antitoxin family protein [Planctomycetota bacterium]
MTLTIRAVYEGGVLRPLEPLTLPEGETVDVTIAKANPGGSPLRAPTPEEEDYARRIKAAKSLDEMFAVMETAPPSPDYPDDIVNRLNESRQLTGFRMPDPKPAGGESQ